MTLESYLFLSVSDVTLACSELGCRENLTVRLGEVEVFTSGVPGRVAIAVGNFERGLSDSVCSCINAVKKEDTMILIIH